MKKVNPKNFNEDLIQCLVIGVVLGLIIVLGILQYQTNVTLREKLNQIDKGIKSSDSINNYTIKGIDETLKSLDKRLKELPEEQRIEKIKFEQTLKQINVMVKNRTAGTLGSGVSIKYKGKYYVLTAGHMADNPDDQLYLYENGNQICKLEIVKQDYKGGMIEAINNDLLLLRPVNKNIQPKFYTELAEVEPITGTEVYIVGNPMGIEDVVSDGRVIVYKDNFMYYKDSTFFGNSGGGVYTHDGKLIGIVSHMINLKPTTDAPDYMIYGAVRLYTIYAFLGDIE
jgi:S1-C subfamily serine protease